MASTVATAFDKVAAEYDRLWSNSVIGMLQREAVWERIDKLFKLGDSILDLGCGTGIDAEHLESRGVMVYGVDSSAGMIAAASRRGIAASQLLIEKIDQLPGRFDGALSNFGALNCLAELEPVAEMLAGKIRPGGTLAICLLGAACFWETAHYLMRGDPQRALRRYQRRSSSSMGVEVSYFSSRAVVNAFSPHFRLAKRYGIGLFVPPSYIRTLSGNSVRCLAAIDRLAAHWPVLRGLSDHCLYIFKRV